MSPDEKHELVEKLQSLEYCVGFCGDGANDCGALKAADVGISLSEAEASVAAPFTSRVFHISCVPEVIREGRAALVTSFSCFKFMSLYSAIQFTSVSILYRSASNLGDIQFLFIDLFLILPLAVFMGWSGPHPVLCPKRPTASLVSRKVLVPLLGQILLQFVVQLSCYMVVKRQSWYIPPVVSDEKNAILNSENTTLFLISCFQYIGAAVVLSVGAPFRQPMRENIPFVITVATGVLFSVYMVLNPASWLHDLMQLTDPPLSFKLFLLIMAAIGFGLSASFEKFILPYTTQLISRLKLALSSGPKKHKIYKMIEREMRV
jgi:cation-transporting ATPase 13A3/4/5